MKAFIVAALFVVACTATPYAGLSSQYHTQDGHGNYAYGYADPNSQKHEESAHGFTRGAYSYVDGHGLLQSVHYTADPHHGFQVAATNLPKGPAPVVAAPALYHAAPLAYAGPWAYHGGYQGGPLETPEVAHAKAAHFAAHAAAHSGLHHLYKRSAHWGGYHVPVIHNGVPVETPEVQQAKAEHAAAHAKVGGHYAYAPVHHGYAPLAPNGVVLDTPEIAAAKSAHFAAHAAAGGHAYAPAHYAAASHHHAGPVDTPEVQHAKALHFAAVADAQSKTGYSHDDGHYDGHYDGRWDDGHYDGRWDGHHGAYTHAAAHHVPVIHNGVPVETPEVQHAKAAHFAAHSEASARAYHHY